MSVASVLARGRRAAEAQMTDTCVVSYATGNTTLDEFTGQVVAESAVRFTSKCKIQARNLVVLDSEVGGRVAETVRAELRLPIDAPAVQPGDVCEIAAVGALSDLSLLGRRFTVQGGTPPKSLATARRLEVEEVVS